MATGKSFETRATKDKNKIITLQKISNWKKLNKKLKKFWKLNGQKIVDKTCSWTSKSLELSRSSLRKNNLLIFRTVPFRSVPFRSSMRSSQPALFSGEFEFRLDSFCLPISHVASRLLSAFGFIPYTTLFFVVFSFPFSADLEHFSYSLGVYYFASSWSRRSCEKFLQIFNFVSLLSPLFFLFSFFYFSQIVQLSQCHKHRNLFFLSPSPSPTNVVNAIKKPTPRIRTLKLPPRKELITK